MNLKNLTITVAVLGVLAALTIYLDSRAGMPPQPDKRVGKPLVSEEDMRMVDRIEITEDGSTTVIASDGDNWVVESYFNLPADFDQLARLARSLVDTEIDRRITAIPEKMERLDLEDKRLVMKAGDRVVADIQIGRRSDSGGTFVKPTDAEAAYLLVEALSVQGGDSDLVDRNVLGEIKADDVASFSFVPTGGGDALTLTRERASEAFALTDLAAGETTKASAARRVLTSLLNANLSEARPRDDAEAAEALEYAKPFTITLFEGESLTILAGRRPKMEVPAEPEDAADQAEDAATGADAEPEDGENGTADADTAEEASDEPKTETKPAGPFYIAIESGGDLLPMWKGSLANLAFKMPSYLHSNMPEAREALVEAAEEPEQE